MKSKNKSNVVIKLFVCFFMVLIGESNAQDWQQVSNTIYGSNSGDGFGRAVALSGDASVIAISSPQNDVNGTNSGKVSVYEVINNQWTQMGSDIDGLDSYNYSGNALKISGDGSTIIIGSATDHDPSNNWYGSVKVYEWNGTDWVQKGSKVYGQSSGGYFGYSIGINNDGSIILVDAPNESNTVRAYEWDQNINSWLQKGSSVSIGAHNGPTDGAIDFSSDGSTFIASNPYFSDGTDLFGKVRVFSWDGNDWLQKGNDFNGEVDGTLGHNISINSNGDTILIGSPLNDNNGNNTGELKIYEWNGTSWQQKGQTFNGSLVDNSKPNLASSIDGLGNTFVYWSFEGDSSGEGVVKAYGWDGVDWIQKGVDLDGGLGDNNLINFINISESGEVISIGFPYDFSFSDGSTNGRVKVYNWIENLSIEGFNNDFKIKLYPNPSDGLSKIQLGENHNEVFVNVFNVLGKQVISQKYNNTNEIELNTQKYANGIYFIKVQSGTKEATIKLVVK